MSTSDPTGPRGASPEGPTTRLIVKAPPDTEVFLIDYTFRLVSRSVGTLTREVPAGIYKLKFRRGDVERTMTTVVSGTADVTVAFGHWSTLGLLMRPDVLSLDTGCVWGGCLSAARIDGGRREIVQVRCEASQRPGSM